jgi:hypothetical protein
MAKEAYGFFYHQVHSAQLLFENLSLVGAEELI